MKEITYEEALKIAKKYKSAINCCTEYNNAYMFSFDANTDGGDAPIVVMKRSGAVRNMIEYAVESGNEFIRTFDV